MSRPLRMAVSFLLIIVAFSASQLGYTTSIWQPQRELLPDLSGASRWARDDIQRAWSLGLTTRRLLKDFQKPITREEFCELLVLLYEKINGQQAQHILHNPFIDTAHPAVLAAYTLGIAKGVSATQFAPYNPLTRQEASYTLVRALRAVEPMLDIQVFGVDPFTDEHLVASWALQAIRFCYRYQIMRDVGANKIDPLGLTTREKAICLVIRTYDAVGHSIGGLPPLIQMYDEEGHPLPGFAPPIRHVILSVFLVPKYWMRHTDMAGWTRAVPYKQTYGVKFYEAAIWEDTHTIQLYAFDNYYLPYDWRSVHMSDAEQLAFRESFCIATFGGMPAQGSERGTFVLNAFTQIAQLLVQRHPNATHNLVFNGHGAPNIGLFTGNLNPAQSKAFLGAWHAALGRRLGVLDMGGPCLMGSFQDLEAYHAHIEYYIASDLLVGGFELDVWSLDNFERTCPHHQYPRLLWAYDFRQALIERIRLRGARYELARNNITTRQIVQSLYLYSSDKFRENKAAIREFMQAQFLSLSDRDIKDTMQRHGAGPTLLAALDEIIIYGVNTKDFFPWPKKRNGLLWSPMPSVSLLH